MEQNIPPPSFMLAPVQSVHFEGLVRIDGRAPIGVVFTDPQIGIVGYGYHAMKPGSFATGRASFEDQGRSMLFALMCAGEQNLQEQANKIIPAVHAPSFSVGH